MTTLAAQITPTGITALDYSDTLTALQNGFTSIYGSDAVLTSDSQDGQFLAIFGQAIYDVNQSLIANYNAYSPASAQGTGLSSIVKINGISRKNPSNSQCVTTVVGQAGTPILGGIVGDNVNLGTQWLLPATVIIPDGGAVDVTVTCTAEGAITAAPGTLTNIITPTLGWQSITNTGSATPGQPIELDPALRQRQSASTSLNSETVLDAIEAAVANITGVGRLQPYENDTDAVDANGIPPHSIAIVAEGGDAVEVATAIASKKGPGCGTYGTTTETVIDQKGVPNVINFFELTEVPISVVITIKALTGYVSTTGTSLVASVASFLSGLGIGIDSYLNRLYSPANLNGDAAIAATGLTQLQMDALSATYNVTSIAQSRSGSPSAADVSIAFNEAATCNPLINVTLVTT